MNTTAARTVEELNELIAFKQDELDYLKAERKKAVEASYPPNPYSVGDMVYTWIGQREPVEVIKVNPRSVVVRNGNWSQWQDGKYTEEVFDGTNTQNRWIMDKPARWPFFSEKGHWEHRTREVNHEEPGYTEEVERWGIHRDEYTPEGIMALAGKMAESIWKREALKPLLGKHEPVGRSDLPEEIQVTLRLSHARK